mgnify:CR=1 FL=1
MAKTKVKSTKFPPIISPSAISGMPWKTAPKSTKKFGKEAAKAIIKKLITNSRQFKYFAIITKDLIKLELNQDRTKQENINMITTKYQVTPIEEF